MIGMCLNLWGSVSGAKAFTKRPTAGPSQRLSAAADAVGAEVWCNPSCTTMGGSIFGLQPTRSPISAGLKLHQICCHPLPSLSAWWLPKEDALLDSHEAMNTWHGQLRCWLFYSQAALIHRVKTWHRSLGICILKHAENDIKSDETTQSQGFIFLGPRPMVRHKQGANGGYSLLFSQLCR